jgi:hypothetical protein
MDPIEELFLHCCRLHSKHFEIWLLIKGYPKYEINSKGKVRNIKTKRILKTRRTTAGYLDVEIRINGKPKKFLIHRLVCIAFWPNPKHKQCVDHIDHNGCNNNVENLRWRTKSENGMNKLKQSNNTSGVIGVSWDRCKMKWIAQIKLDGKTKNVGRFDSKTEAKRARKKAETKYFGEFANAL